MAPNNYNEWLEVSYERASEAEAVCRVRPKAIGSVYLAGYTVECSLKAFLQKQGKPFPKHGSQGHNLKHLWKSSGLKLADIQDSKGVKAFFIESWDTSLRYEIELSAQPGLEIRDLLEGAKQLTGWINTQSRRSRKRKF